MFKRVLEEEELKVAGVRWENAGVANYMGEEPTGFWPEYLTAIVAEINAHYQTNIVINRMYYETSNLVVDAVGKGDADMSEPYYYVAGFYDTAPRIEAMHSSCVTVGTQGNFFVKADSGINTLEQLYDAIVNAAVPDVGFIGAGNAQSVSSILPSNTFYKDNIVNGSQLADQVVSGNLVAGYVSEGHPPQAERFTLIPTGIVAPRVVLFRKDEPTCADTVKETETDSGVIAGLIILAVAVLVLVATLSVLIVREKRGHPVFAPLLANAENKASDQL